MERVIKVDWTLIHSTEVTVLEDGTFVMEVDTATRPDILEISGDTHGVDLIGLVHYLQDVLV